MSKRHDDQSPVHDYLRRYRTAVEDPPTHQYLPARARPLTPEVISDLNHPLAREYLAAIAGNPQALAEALVHGLSDHLQYKRDVVNFWRQFIGLPARPMRPEEHVQYVMTEITKLYEQVRTLTEAQNKALDARIETSTKQQKHDLEHARYKTQLLQEQVTHAKLERELDDITEPRQPLPLLQTRAEVRAGERDEVLQDAELETALAGHRAKRAEHAAQAAYFGQKKYDAEHPPIPEPPPRPLTPEEREAQRLRREQAKATVIAKLEARCRKELGELAVEFGRDSQEYKDREAYWNHRLITTREMPLDKF